MNTKKLTASQIKFLVALDVAGGSMPFSKYVNTAYSLKRQGLVSITPDTTDKYTTFTVRRVMERGQ